MAEKTYYTVGEICEKTSITRKTLFYYDRIDLLKPSRRAGLQKHKEYDSEAYARLLKIISLRNGGLTIEEIRSIFDEHGPKESEVLKKALLRLQNDLRHMQDQISHLKRLIEECDE